MSVSLFNFSIEPLRESQTGSRSTYNRIPCQYEQMHPTTMQKHRDERCLMDYRRLQMLLFFLYYAAMAKLYA